MRKNNRYYCTEEPKESASSKLKRFKARQYNRAMLSGLTIGFIGAGNMAEALISGLLHGKRITPAQLLASDINASKVARLRENYKIEAASTNRDVAKQADVLVLAVAVNARVSVRSKPGAVF